MKIKEQTRKLAAGCSKHRFEVVDKTDEVSHIYTARRRWRGLNLIFEEYHITNIMKQAVIDALDTVALNRK